MKIEDIVKKINLLTIISIEAYVQTIQTESSEKPEHLTEEQILGFIDYNNKKIREYFELATSNIPEQEDIIQQLYG